MITFYPPKGPDVLLLLFAAGEPTGRFLEELHQPPGSVRARYDDLTIAMLVVRVRPYCYFKVQTDLKSGIRKFEI